MSFRSALAGFFLCALNCHPRRQVYPPVTYKLGVPPCPGDPSEWPARFLKMTLGGPSVFLHPTKWRIKSVCPPVSVPIQNCCAPAVRRRAFSLRWWYTGRAWIGGSKVMVRRTLWKPLVVIDRNAMMCETSNREVRHESGIGENKMESPGFSLPLQASFLSVPIEEDFGEPTAVIISITEERNSFHHWCFV